jgi:hypothetical protein
MAGAVWFDGTRVNDADSLTGWVNDGSTATLEPEYFYQGTGCISSQVKTTEMGFYYTSGAQNLSTTNGTWLAKVIQTNKDAIDGLGLQLRVGSTNANYYRYEIFSSITYPASGGWQIVPVNPNVASYRTQTVGTPNLASVTYWSLRSDSTVQARTPNLGMDAIDWIPNSKGLSLSGSSADFSDFVLFDEGTTTNRYGVVISREGIIYCLGTLTIGNSNVTTFLDDSRILIFPNGRFDTNFSGLAINLLNSATTVNFNSITLIGRGTTGTTTDTRPVFNVTNTGGTLNLNSCVLTSFNTIIFNNKTTIDTTNFNVCGNIIQSGSTISNSIFTEFTSGVTLKSNDLSKISYCNFISDGSNHAIEITVAGTYNFIGNTFTNYSTAISGTTGNEAIYNTSGGLVTINVSDGDTPSYRNSTGSSTVVNNNVSVTFTGMKDNTEVRIFSAGTTTELAGVENATDGTIDNRSFTFSLGVGVNIDYRIHNLSYVIIEIYNYPMPSSSTSLPIQQQTDRWII